MVGVLARLSCVDGDATWVTYATSLFQRLQISDHRLSVRLRRHARERHVIAGQLAFGIGQELVKIVVGPFEARLLHRAAVAKTRHVAALQPIAANWSPKPADLRIGRVARDALLENLLPLCGVLREAPEHSVTSIMPSVK